MRHISSYRHCGWLGVMVGAVLSCAGVAGAVEYDRTKYASPDELRPGMKGFGRTVMSGARIDTFEFEVVSVMKNAYYAKQDVILVRCKGLNLEHSGIIGGMSGSPCYIREDDGRVRMIGAVAYGWQFNKDPLCGVQPITQMLSIPEVRTPKESDGQKGPQTAPAQQAAHYSGGAISISELVAKVLPEPIPAVSRFSVLNDENMPVRKELPSSSEAETFGRMTPLLTPVMVSGASDRGLSMIKDRFEKLGLMPMASGGPSGSMAEEFKDVKLEPGSTICIPLMRGDINMEALGTCTEVIGDRVLGFGHSMFGEGEVELPVATGMVHTVIPSVMRSNKLGAALQVVGTLRGDESSGIYGITGKAPSFVPFDVTVHDVRGTRTYHYEIAREEFFTGLLIRMALAESVYAHSSPPKEHTIRYSIETVFEGLGSYKTSNYSSQDGTGNMEFDLSIPVMLMMNTPFAKASVQSSKVEVWIEEGANAAEIDDATLLKSVYKPGEKVQVNVRWFHYRKNPSFTTESYTLTLPEDIEDGQYEMVVGSAFGQLSATRREKPQWFLVQTLPQMLEMFNRIGSFPQDRMYMRLGLKTRGVAISKLEMPELPSFRQQIVADSSRTDVMRFTDAIVAQHKTPFAVKGNKTFTITVKRNQG